MLPAHLRENVVGVPVTPTLNFKHKSNAINDYFGRQSDAVEGTKTKSFHGQQVQGNIISATFTIPDVIKKQNGDKWVRRYLKIELRTLF